MTALGQRQADRGAGAANVPSPKAAAGPIARPSVLFVCTANRCRSPVAAALFHQKLAGAGLDGMVRVESAGTWAEEGLPTTSLAKEAASERRLDLEGHRSRSVSASLLRQFALILVMEAGQREALHAEFPEVADRIHLLTATAGSAYDLADPHGTDLSGYRRLIEELEALLDRGFERILALAGGTRSHA